MSFLKTLAAGCAAALLLRLPVAGAQTPLAAPEGDVDGDGAVTSDDARLALQYAAERLELDPAQQLRSDADGDGQVTSTDARYMLAYAAGKYEPGFRPLAVTVTRLSAAPVGTATGRTACTFATARPAFATEEAFLAQSAAQWEILRATDGLPAYDEAFFENHVLLLITATVERRVDKLEVQALVGSEGLSLILTRKVQKEGDGSPTCKAVLLELPHAALEGVCDLKLFCREAPVDPYELPII